MTQTKEEYCCFRNGKTIELIIHKCLKEESDSGTCRIYKKNDDSIYKKGLFLLTQEFELQTDNPQNSEKEIPKAESITRE